jgi:hypothetical protein
MQWCSKGKERKYIATGINELKPELKEYTLPFNSENFGRSLVISDEASSEKPHQITNIDQFRDKPFDDLWTEVTTPKFKLDRSYKDNLNDSHIG